MRVSDDFIVKLNSYFKDDALVKVWVLDLFALFARVQDDESDGKLQAAEWTSNRGQKKRSKHRQRRK